MQCLLKMDVYVNGPEEVAVKRRFVCLSKRIDLPFPPFIGLDISLKPTIYEDDPRAAVLSEAYKHLTPASSTSSTLKVTSVIYREGEDALTLRCRPLACASLQELDAVVTRLTLDFEMVDFHADVREYMEAIGEEEVDVEDEDEKE